MANKVKVVNNTTGNVGYTVPNLHVRRVFRPQQTLMVTFEELEEGLYEPGIRKLFENGFLTIENKQDRIDLGLAMVDEKEEIVEDAAAPTHTQIKAALKSNKYADLYLLMKDAPSGTLSLVVDYALELEITDTQKLQLIKDKTGSDITAILQKRKAINE